MAARSLIVVSAFKRWGIKKAFVNSLIAVAIALILILPFLLGSPEEFIAGVYGNWFYVDTPSVNLSYLISLFIPWDSMRIVQGIFLVAIFSLAVNTRQPLSAVLRDQHARFARLEPQIRDLQQRYAARKRAITVSTIACRVSSSTSACAEAIRAAAEKLNGAITATPVPSKVKPSTAICQLGANTTTARDTTATSVPA